MKLFNSRFIPFVGLRCGGDNAIGVALRGYGSLDRPSNSGFGSFDTLQGSDPLVSADRSDDADLKVRGRSSFRFGSLGFP